MNFETIETNNNFYLPVETETKFEFDLDKENSKKLINYIGLNILTKKKFKKMLMSVGFDRNEANYINNIFKYNGQKRYSYFINNYKNSINGLKYYIRKMR